jgi:hypothetical protein
MHTGSLLRGTQMRYILEFFFLKKPPCPLIYTMNLFRIRSQFCRRDLRMNRSLRVDSVDAE